MLWRLCLLAAFLLPSAFPQTVPLEGTYAGTLQAGDAKLHLVLHISKGSDGALNATLDSLDQGVFAIEATAVKHDATTLKLEIGSVGARYQGKFSPDHRTITGDWSQGQASLPLVFKKQAAGALAKKGSDAVSPVEGLWQAALSAQGMRFRFQLHLSHDLEGELVGALDNLDQGVTGLPASNITVEDAKVHFEIPALAGIFEGTLNPAQNTLAGNWSQTGADSKLEFKRSDTPLELRRPQTPVKPFPYFEQDVAIQNTKADVTLAGTLTLPKGSGPFPAVILIAGSGPQDRDESTANHKPFLVLTDQLTRKGFAVLRYDKRGYGKSTGSPQQATTEDLAGDTKAAVDFLKGRKEIDPARIGLLGHSEGALIAPMVAAKSPDICWLVLLGAPATTGEQTLLKQSELIGRTGGLTNAQLLASLSFDRDAYDLVRQEKDPAALKEKLKKLIAETGLEGALPPYALESQIQMLSSPWFRFFLEYDPRTALREVRVPVLAIYGQKDLQVPPAENLPLLTKTLEAAGNSRVDARDLPGLNHLLQHAYSGSPSEFGAIEETIAPEALDAITSWLLRQTGSQKPGT